MNKLHFIPDARFAGLILLAMVLMLVDLGLRVWVPPAEAPVAGDQTERALSQSQPPEARLARPFDPFYENVATRSSREEAVSADSEPTETAREIVFDYRVLAVSELQGGRLRAAIRMTRRERDQGDESDGGKPERQIETLEVGDTIGDAQVTGISEREVRLESESLGALTLTLFLSSRAEPENGSTSAEL